MMGWPGIDYEELGDLGVRLISCDLVPMPSQAIHRIDSQLNKLKEEVDAYQARTSFKVASDFSKRIEVIQKILHNPKYISEEEVALNAKT